MHEVGMEAQRPATKRVRRGRSTPVDDMSMDIDAHDTNMDVDIDGEDDLPETSVSAARNSKTSAAKRRRSAAAFSSDDGGFGEAATADDRTSGGDDDDFRDTPSPRHQDVDFRDASSPRHQLNDGDFDPGLPPVRSKPVRAKTATWKVRNGEDLPTNRKVAKKSVTAAKAGKGKAVKKEKEREIMVKDERKDPPLTDAPKLSRAHSSSKDVKQRSKSQIKDEIKDEDVPVDIFDEPIASAPEIKPEEEHSPPPAPAPVAALPPKKKLPPIRKHKPVASGSNTSTPSQAPVPPPKAPVPSASTSSAAASTASAISDKLLGIAKPRKQPGSADFDLRDTKAWEAIFKQVGFGWSH